MRFLISPGMVLAISMAGCGGGATGMPDGAPRGGGGAGAGERDATGGDSGDGGTSLSHCPVEPDVRGPPLARVRWADGIAFCVDSTEVTNAEYAMFLAAGVPVTGQGPRCAWNATFTPEATSTNGPACPTFDGVGRADYPVVCVDWCDADAYCRWAGKHLCQKPGGGAVAAIAAKNASEWVIACTGDGTRKFPYGNTAEPGRCVDHQFPGDTPGLRPVKSAQMCEGGVPGLFDMSGNAGEWQNDCTEAPGSGGDDSCPPLGGSFAAEVSNVACTDFSLFFRKQVAGDTGFRCCVDALFF